MVSDIELLGYIALIVSLISMSMKKMVMLRSLHIASSILFGIYAYLIESYPIMVSASLFIGIHLVKLYKERHKTVQSS